MRAQRSRAADLSAACEVPCAATDNEASTSPRHASEWAEIKQQLAEMVHEIEVTARERPLLGIVSAFLAGLLCGRLLSE